MISVIAIVARDGAIGRGGDQPFHIREDFKRFKALTLGHPIVMGRRTFEALPTGALPERRNIVVTRSAHWSAPDVETARSLDEAVAMAGNEDLFIIGGGEIYRQSLPMADRLYLTEVDATVEGADTFFPDVDPEQWRAESTSEPMTDPRSGATFRFVEYVKR